MAIQFARTEVISAGKGSSAVGLSAYIAREDRRAEATDNAYGFAHRDDDLEHCAVYLPEDAPAWMRDGKLLWNAAEKAELTQDRKTGEVRFMVNAQLAKHTVLALPKELNAGEQRELLESFIAQNYTKHGVAVEAAIHSPHEGGDNWHAHLLVTTRVIDKNGIGKKARHLNPNFVKGQTQGDQIGERWAEHQNAYFGKKGLDVTVDTSLAIPSNHIGKGRFVDESDAQKESEKRHAQNVRLIIEKPHIVTSKLTEKKPFFTEREVSRYLFKAGFDGEDFDRSKSAIMAHGVPLYDRKTGQETGKFTTQNVRQQEREIMRAAEKLASRNRHRISPTTIMATAAFKGLSKEQHEAYLSAVNNGRDLSVWRGIAGAGKSRSMNVVRSAYEHGGYNVLGLAPTNVVVRDMERDGFKEARTVHSFLYGLEKGTLQLDSSTVLFVEEAAMVDNERLLPLLNHAVRSGAKVILVGDDRQLASVERGGMFTAIREKHGASELRQVHRQHEDWSKQASIDFADGRVEEAVKAYDKHDRITWTEDTREAKKELIAAWKRDTEVKSTKTRFVYAQTNKDVNELNAALRQVRLERGDLGQAHTFETVRGKVELSERDRIQFYKNDRQAGIYNGYVGTIERIEGRNITARLDNGHRVSFDAKDFPGFGLGYVGTVYRGQGKTQLETYHLHTPLSDSRTSYVAMTRHRDNVSLFVGRATTPDVRSLARQMGRQNDCGPSLRYATKDELQRERSKGASPLKVLDDQQQEKAMSARRKFTPLKTKDQGKAKTQAKNSLDLKAFKPPTTEAGRRLMENMKDERSERTKGKGIKRQPPGIER